LISVILWIWFPIEKLNWKIFSKWWIGIVVSLVIFIPGGIIVFKGVRDAGKETLTPSKDTQMYGGIYKYIRHPQTTGEMPMFPAFGLIVNSWFMVAILTIFILIYVPIIQYFEEKDLIERFGDSYVEYQKTTGAFFPKWIVLKNLFRKEK
jgi:protein-S-isoprenylcysteine O-methyltransferase Ste14